MAAKNNLREELQEVAALHMRHVGMGWGVLRANAIGEHYDREARRDRMQRSIFHVRVPEGCFLEGSLNTRACLEDIAYNVYFTESVTSTGRTTVGGSPT